MLHYAHAHTHARTHTRARAHVHARTQGSKMKGMHPLFLIQFANKCLLKFTWLHLTEFHYSSTAPTLHKNLEEEINKQLKKWK
jgi:hypothetical protein